jgi:hypothetical protein
MTTEACAPKSESAKKNEDWMNTKWRPAMGWMYMLVCITDFVLFPILWSLVQVVGDGKVESQWVPITLQGAGLFHIAMGAILGIAAYGRTQEKMAGANNGGIQLPGATPAPSSFGTPAPRSYTPAPSFGNAPLGGNSMSTAPSFGRGPIQPEHPEI